jgi:hypothetical protein
VNLQHTCIKEKKKKILKATDISTVQMLKCIGNIRKQLLSVKFYRVHVTVTDYS